MPSTAKGGAISRIVPLLKEGSAITTSRNDVHYIVTEYGIADMRGKTLKARAKALVDIAHPKFRSELSEHIERRFKEV
jgi:4-hydroxybutyrate CoA-transferase